MDPATAALKQTLPEGVPRTFAILEKRSSIPRSTLRQRARGRRSRQEKARSQQYLTPEEETALVRYLLTMCDLGHPLPIKYLACLAFIMAQRRSTNRATKRPGKNWACAFQRRHPELKSRRMKAIDWKRHDSNIREKVASWFEVIQPVLESADVQLENVYNMDETGVMLSMLGSAKVIVGKDHSGSSRGAGVKRTMVTAVECISADGRALHPLIIWPAATHRSNWTTHPTPGWHYAHSENGYNDSKISIEWFRCVFDPQTREKAGLKPRVLICDGFGTHETLEVLEFCFANNIFLCRLPSHTSHKLQPCDVGVFAPLKNAYRDEVNRLYRTGVDNVGKEDFALLYSAARRKAFTKRNIISAWAATGLTPFNPDRVLRSIAAPTVCSPMPNVQDTSCPTVEIIQTQQTLQSPVTPMTPETSNDVATLEQLILRSASSMDQMQRKRIQKLACATKTSIAYNSLLHEDLRSLRDTNKEQKRRATRSVVLGKAKVMSFDDLEAARQKRAINEAAKIRGRSSRNSGRSLQSVEDLAAKSTKPDEADRLLVVTAHELQWRAPIARML